MGSREDILRSLRAAAVPATPLPDLVGFGQRFPDLRERFSQSVAEVGGRCVRLDDIAALDDELSRIPEYLAAKKVVSLLPGVKKANVELPAIADPHELADLDYCVIGGELGVAENGAVWVTNHGLKNRAACFLSQHIAIVVRADSLVHNLHEAYDRISIPQPGFGMFLSGPSKTADIEQALVIGAHGARSCTVLLVG